MISRCATCSRYDRSWKRREDAISMADHSGQYTAARRVLHAYSVYSGTYGMLGEHLTSSASANHDKKFVPRCLVFLIVQCGSLLEPDTCSSETKRYWKQHACPVQTRFKLQGHQSDIVSPRSGSSLLGRQVGCVHVNQHAILQDGGTTFWTRDTALEIPSLSCATQNGMDSW